MSRYCHESKAKKVIAQKGLKSLSFWAGRAQEEEAIGSDAEAVTSYVIARQFSRAAKVGIDVLKRIARDPLDLTIDNKRLLSGLKYCRAEDLDEPQRTLFLLYILWFTAHEAASNSLWDTACSMLAKLSSCISTVNCALHFVLAESEVNYQLLFFTICAGNKGQSVVLAESVLRAQIAAQGSETTITQLLTELAGLLKSAAAEVGCSSSSGNDNNNTTAASRAAGGGAVLLSSALKHRSTQSRMAEGVWGDHTLSIMR